MTYGMRNSNEIAEQSAGAYFFPRGGRWARTKLWAAGKNGTAVTLAEGNTMSIFRNQILILSICAGIVSYSLTLATANPAPVYRSIARIELALPLEGYDKERVEIAVNDEILRIKSAHYLALARDRLQMSGEEIGARIVAIEAARVKDSTFVEISVDSIDPILAAEMANALAITYIDMEEYPSVMHPKIRQMAKPDPNPISLEIKSGVEQGK